MRKKKKNIVLQQVLVSDYAAEGKSLARVDGKVIFMEGVVPGDRVEIKDRQLWHNGEIAPGQGYQKVMSQKDGYNGYLGNHLFNLEEDQYLALGDNSMSSLDSRYWGHVPAKNIVGRAIFVYLPLGNHFGPIH